MFLGNQKEYDPVRDRQNRDATILVRNSNILVFRWRNNKYMCFCCKEMFLEMPPLRRHTEESHKIDDVIEQIHNRYYPALPKADITSLLCNLCHIHVTDLKSLIEHLKEIHKLNLESPNEEPLIPYKLQEGAFQCQKCQETFEVFKTLNNHMNKHFGTYICYTCGTGFQHEFALKSHERRHNLKEHKCDKCNLTFQTSYKKLLHHYSVHKKGGRYGCPQCTEKFMDYDKRSRHLARTHGIERPVSNCVQCGKCFKNNRLLNQHVRYFHLNERKHVCHICGHKYFNKSELKKHFEGHVM